MNILEQLSAHARLRVAADRSQMPLGEMSELARSLPARGENPFESELKRPALSFICEVKRASPSKGLIAPEFPYVKIAEDYAAAGAEAISCLTEPKWFLGSDAIFREIRAAVKTPMVLLICAILDAQTIERYLGICAELGLAALVETHDAEEIDMAIAVGARIIGVNNRNLRDFTVDFSNAARLRDRIPPSCVYVAESGVKSPEDAAALKAIGADAALVGEALMRAENKDGFLRSLREAAK